MKLGISLNPRVLLAVTLSEWGGAQHIVYLLAKHLREQYDISVACAPGGELIAELQRDNIPVVEISSLRRNPHLWHDLRAFWQLFCLMKRERFDIVHTHSTKAGLIGRLSARWAGVPAIIFTAHGWAFTQGRSSWKRWALALVERWAALFTNKIICVSEHDRQLALAFKIARPEQLVLIRNGLYPCPFLQADRTQVRNELMVTKPTVTFVARFAPPKEPLQVLKALRALPNCQALFVGDGPLRSAAQRWAARNGLADRVWFTGTRRDIPNILAASDIFVLASRWEGSPLVIIEAMLAGLPVVATDVGGVCELVEHGITGFLVPAGDVDALAEALRKLLEDKSLQRKMGEAGRARALERFTLDRMIAQYRHLYKELVEDR